MAVRRNSNKLRNSFYYHILRKVIAPFFKRRYGFKYAKAEPDGNEYSGYIVVANHVTAADPLLISMSFPRPMYFACDEAYMRNRLSSALLRHCISPIECASGVQAVNTMREILRELRDNGRVCLFPESGATFSGKTGSISTAVGKLVKQSGAALITYKFTGGYFTHPRWSDSIRRGSMRGEAVGIYPAKEIAKLSAEEINAIIERDINEDAYRTQGERHQAYRAQRLAEGLERALYYCPECGSLGELYTVGNAIICRKCGAKSTMDEYGTLSGGRFGSISEWDDCQRGFISEFARTGGIASQDGILMTLEEVRGRIRRKRTGMRGISAEKGMLLAGMNGRTDSHKAFDIGAIYNMALIGCNCIMFEYGGTRYELSGGSSFCARMFYDFLEASRIHIGKSERKIVMGD